MVTAPRHRPRQLGLLAADAARTHVMRHPSCRQVPEPPSGPGDPQTEFQVLRVHEPALVQPTKRSHEIAANQNACAADPTNVAWAIIVHAADQVAALKRRHSRAQATQSGCVRKHPPRRELPTGRKYPTALRWLGDQRSDCTERTITVECVE